MSSSPNSSYGRILRTSAMLGGSSLIGVAMAIIRTKVLAVHLGPGPYGIMSLYGTLLAIVGAVAGLGIGTTAVREIAEAAGKGDEMEVAHTTVAIRRVVWITGLLGMVVTVMLAWPASLWTFGSGKHVWAFVVLSLTVFVAQISGGQTALLQGLRRIQEISFISVAGAVLGTALAIPILLCLGERGIVPFMLATSFGALLVSWYFARRVKTAGVKQCWRETWHRSRQMIRLGLVLMATGMFAMLANYLVRLIIQFRTGETGVGLYNSAFALSGTYVGFILAAMGTDYYPRLTEVAGDREKRNRLVNEQTDMALILGVPGLVAAIALAEVIIWTFYSSRFGGAPEILRWTVLGLFGRIVSWPIGFILLARSDKRAFFWSELLAWSTLVALTFVLVRSFGTVGAGMAFAGMYLCLLGVIYSICKWRHDFAWNAASAKRLSIAALLVGGTFGATYIGQESWRYVIEFTMVVAAIGFSVAGLYSCFGRDRFVAGLTRLKSRFRSIYGGYGTGKEQIGG